MVNVGLAAQYKKARWRHRPSSVVGETGSRAQGEEAVGWKTMAKWSSVLYLEVNG